MSDSPSPAQLLAAVLRVVAPGVYFLPGTRTRLGVSEPEEVVIVRGVLWKGRQNETLNPASKDDLARVVAMLTPSQLVRFDQEIHRTLPDPFRPSASMVLKADPNTILAALVAATGAKA